MKIAVNTRLLIKNRLEGIGWFTFETLKRITQAHPEHEFIYLFDRPFDPGFITSDNITPLNIGVPSRHPVLWYLWFEEAVPRAIKRTGADLFLSQDGYLSLRARVPQFLVIHDINFWHKPKDLPWLTSAYLRHFTPHYAHKAGRLATVSEYSRQDICKTFGVGKEKVDVVYNGVNEQFVPVPEALQEATRKRYTGGHPYFIFVGAMHPRKNIARLLRAYSLFRRNHPGLVKLVLVGDAMFKTQDMQQAYQAMAYKEDVIFAGRQAPQQLHLLTGSAMALTFVPYFEGFGIPILEAMRCHVPVITSTLTAMPEVAGDAALLVDPLDVGEISRAMQRIAQDSMLRQSLVEKAKQQSQQFSWEKTAQALWQGITQLF